MRNRTAISTGLLILRLGLGIIFITHGYFKLTDIAGTSQFFASLGIPLPGIAAPLIGLLEVIGGIALILGVGVSLFAGLLLCTMVVAIVTVKLSKGFVGGYEYEVVLGLGLLALLFTGPGNFALRVPGSQRSKGARGEIVGNR